MTAAESYTGKPTEAMFRKSLRETDAKRARENASSLRQMAQGEVAANLLTGDPNWDVFLRLVQAKIEECEAAAKESTEKAMDPDLDPNMVFLFKTPAIRYLECARALLWVLGIPKAIKDDALEAKEILEELHID
jgi:hypothetical protein